MTDTQRLEHLLSIHPFEVFHDGICLSYRLIGQHRWYETKRAAVDAAIFESIIRKFP